MALFQAHFKSTVLELNCSANVILPNERQDTARPLACLWLLHGLSDDHTAWQRCTSIERYAEKYRLAVIMPAVDCSFYADMKSGLKYWTYLSEELPLLMRQYFPLSTQRQDNFVAGLSMGGYGAFKLALNFPERYAAAASFSGALDLNGTWFTARTELKRLVFGGSLEKGSVSDLFHVAQKLACSRKPKPRLYQWCGTEDFLYQDNLRFRDHARKIKLPVDYSEGPGGHTWDKWDEQIEKALAWMKLEKT